MKRKLLFISSTFVLLMSACNTNLIEPTSSPKSLTSTLLPAPTNTQTPKPIHPPTETLFPFAKLGFILFSSSRNGMLQTFIMNPDGSQQTLWVMESGPVEMAWSPAGTRVAIVSLWKERDAEILVMNADGSDLTQLTDNSASDSGPTWSPDGTRIAFASTRDSIQGLQAYDGLLPEIYVMNADGSGQRRLTNNNTADYCPSWSPDGLQIVYSSGGEINIMNADGTGQTQLVDTPGDDICPVWSPDGTRIVFESRSEGGSFMDIFVVNADGSNLINLTEHPAINGEPRWSPDGNWIVFSSDRDGDQTGLSDIFVMSAQGLDVFNLTKTPTEYEWNPIWVP